MPNPTRRLIALSFTSLLALAGVLLLAPALNGQTQQTQLQENPTKTVHIPAFF
jgi:hypothetical protein